MHPRQVRLRIAEPRLTQIRATVAGSKDQAAELVGRIPAFGGRG